MTRPVTCDRCTLGWNLLLCVKVWKFSGMKRTRHTHPLGCCCSSYAPREPDSKGPPAAASGFRGRRGEPLGLPRGPGPSFPPPAAKLTETAASAPRGTPVPAFRRELTSCGAPRGPPRFCAGPRVAQARRRRRQPPAGAANSLDPRRPRPSPGGRAPLGDVTAHRATGQSLAPPPLPSRCLLGLRCSRRR